jgi:hypothetical protein
MKMILRSAIFMISIMTLAAGTFAQASPEWTESFPPYRIMGNLYYVGSKGLASYLITAPQGNILINSSLERYLFSASKGLNPERWAAANRSDFAEQKKENGVVDGRSEKY